MFITFATEKSEEFSSAQPLVVETVLELGVGTKETIRRIREKARAMREGV